MTKNTKLTALLLAMALLCGCGSSQTGYDPLAGVETKTVTDSSGRSVEVPAEITRVAPSGSTAQMLLMPIAYDLLVGLSSSPSTAQRPYFPEEMWYLPTFGQFYGSKASLNMEALIAAQPQVILDLGDAKESIADDMDRIQKQTGIPTLFIEADLDDMAAAYRAADLMVSRAGASTISEIQLLGIPSVLVPSPNVAEDHQRKNAQALADRDAAVMVLDADAPRLLGETVTQLMADPERRKTLGRNALEMALRDSDEKITDCIYSLIN